MHETKIEIACDGARLDGDLALPQPARGIVLFAHGSGSSRHSPRNRQVARSLQDAGLATLLLDLLTEEEDEVDSVTGEHRFDISLLAQRVATAATSIADSHEAGGLPIGYFGASTGAAAALVAAAEGPDVSAIVSRGGRPDLAGDALSRVKPPTLLIVGGHDEPVIGMNRSAQAMLHCENHLEIVDGATHLFEEPGAIEEVSSLARDWFLRHLG